MTSTHSSSPRRAALRVHLPVERRSLAEQVRVRLKEMILAGKLAGGRRVPEEALAAEFGVSRTPVREALRQLAQYGLVRFKPRSYAEVVRLGAQEATDIVEVRQNLERLAVERLAGRAGPEDIAALRSLSHECRALLGQRNIAAVFDADSRLHLEIARRGGNQALYEAMDRLDAKVQLVRVARRITEQTIVPMLRQHERIIDAIAAHDAAAAGRLMDLHVQGFADGPGNEA